MMGSIQDDTCSQAVPSLKFPCNYFVIGHLELASNFSKGHTWRHEYIRNTAGEPLGLGLVRKIKMGEGWG
jgi:hypothetical protein